jgi:DNA repair exonuclease SbcCD ATPase subunit
MTLEDTEQVLKRHFSKKNYEKLDEKGVFRCIKNYQDSPYQILYIDCKNEWMDDEFNLEKYQEKYLLKDYYSNSAHLQWNNYFIFLSEKEKIEQCEGQRKKIEEDEIYTRKYVLPADEFEDWLIKPERITKKTNGEIQEDLSSKWMNMLRKSKLDCVFLKDESYKEGVQKFLEGNPLTEEDLDGVVQDNGFSEHITSILELKLDDYRLFPAQKNFQFKKVNLIKGVNGTGKTSLLEAIELLLCGKTYRNPDENYSNYNLKVLYEGNSSHDEFDPDNIALYKRRDECWYNNPYHPGSIKTHLNFRKYNFFNSDAAFELSNKPNGFGVKEAFEDIALGEMVNTIETRMEKYLERFQRELRNYNKSINEWNKEKKDEENIIKRINEADDDPKKFYQEFLSEIKKHKWQINKDLERAQILIRFEKDYLRVEKLIDSIKESVNWLDPLSQKTVQEQRVKHQEISKWLDEVNKELRDIKEKIKIANSDLAKMQELLSDLNKLESYYEVPNIDRLSGLNKKINDVQTEINKYSRIKNHIEKADFKFLENKSGLISDYEKELSEQLKKVEKDNDEITSKIEKTREGLNLLEQLVTEIKTKGGEFIENYPDANECPLCHHEYENNELAKNINKAHESFKQSEVLEDLLKKKTEVTKKIEKFEIEDENLSVIQKIGYELYGDNYTEHLIDDFISDTEKNTELLKKSQQSKNEFESIKQQFEDKGLTEEEFENLLENLEARKVNISNKEELDDQLKKREDEIVAAKEIIQKSELKEKEIIEEKERKLNNIVIGREVNEEVFNTQLKQLSKAYQNFEELGEIVGFNEELELFNIEDKVDQLYELFKKVKDLFKDHEQNEIRLKTANEKIQNLDNKINSSKPILEQARKAVSVIEDILENHSKRAFLRDFFKNNRIEILEIFKLIHNPREFINLKFDENDKDSIKLKRETGNFATLNEISSGQRSALALSIFLALNKKLKNGPDILLFDDPVATIDDLNTISFLDYLREVSINSNRQIFFATANEDLAYLFKKKFDFLGDETEDFELERN